MHHKPQSAFVDQVMQGPSEEEKAEASERWFRLLEILLRMADRSAKTCEHCWDQDGGGEDSLPAP